MVFKGKRVFISGGNGVIGKELVERLYKLGAHILVGDLKPINKFWPEDIHYRQGDLNFITRDELLQFEPEFFFHLAATFERSVETYEFWDENFHHNVNLSNHLITLLKDSKSLIRVIFASSYLIYDPNLYNFDKPRNKPFRLREIDPISPRNLTGAAKLLHEIELRFLNEFKKDNFTSVSARIFRSYGKYSRDIISRWIRALLRGETIKVYSKEGIFDYIYAGDVAEGLIRLAKADNASGIVNLGTDNSRRVEEVLTILRNHFPDMRYDEVDSDIPYEASQANMDLYEQFTGWRPSQNIEDTIPNLIEFEKNDDLNEETGVATNVLITSISKKIPLIKSVRNGIKKYSTNFKLFGGDCDERCIGKHFVDEFWKMPQIEGIDSNSIVEYCKTNRINAIIPTRDNELLFWAQNRKFFAEQGIVLMISDFDAIRICLDKLLFYTKLKEMGYPAIQTSLNVTDLETDRYTVKEQFGAGSANIGLNLIHTDAIDHAKSMKKPIFQPYIEGNEVSVDIYVSKSGITKGVICRRRELIVGGESQITTTFRNKRLENMCMSLVQDLNLYGHVVLQIVIDNKENFHIIECNSRFGGASTLSIAAGLDSFYWFMLEVSGVDISNYAFHRNRGELRQVRFPSDNIFSLL